MSRTLRGKGPRPIYRGRFSRFLLSRAASAARVRFAVGSLIMLVAFAALVVAPRHDLHAPVVGVLIGDVPNLPLENLAAVLSTDPAPPAEPAFEPIDALLAGLEPRRLGQAATAVAQEVRRGGFPGAALVAGRGSHVVEKRGLGVVAPGAAAVDPDETLYDLASLTKVLATTSAVALLVEDGAMELDAPVSRYLPEFAGGAKSRVTVRQLLTHTSGLPAGVGLPAGSADVVRRRLVATPLKWQPGQRVEYSDIGPVVLYLAAERVAGESLEAMIERRVFRPLGMRQTGFNPTVPCRSCAPTAASIHGRVHDPIARRLGGVAGNAGLFSTASDVGRFAAMLANGGELEGVRVLRAETVELFTSRQRGAGSRALGWDTRTVRPRAGPSTLAFGHTGFTGTSIWIDPDRGTWAVLLTNRTYIPRAPNRIQAVRRTVNERLAEAADLAPAD
jgi:serine-type D-Ala-D-Ala carboxypeptidase